MTWINRLEGLAEIQEGRIEKKKKKSHVPRDILVKFLNSKKKRKMYKFVITMKTLQKEKQFCIRLLSSSNKS